MNIAVVDDDADIAELISSSPHRTEKSEIGPRTSKKISPASSKTRPIMTMYPKVVPGEDGGCDSNIMPVQVYQRSKMMGRNNGG